MKRFGLFLGIVSLLIFPFTSMAQDSSPEEKIAVVITGWGMSSNYNSRPRAAEVMVRDNRYEIIRQRESYEDLIRGEQIPSFLK